MKTWKNQAQKLLIIHNWLFLGSFFSSAHMAENWFPILEIKLRHPLFFLLCAESIVLHWQTEKVMKLKIFPLDYKILLLQLGNLFMSLVWKHGWWLLPALLQATILETLTNGWSFKPFLFYLFPKWFIGLSPIK